MIHSIQNTKTDNLEEVLERGSKYLKFMINKKLPNCFSITNKSKYEFLNVYIDLIMKSHKFDSDVKQTMDVRYRKVQSEQVSPRTLIHENDSIPSIMNDGQASKFYMSKISKQEWDDPNRFAPIINHF